MPRKSSPWFRKSTGRWYVTIHGKQTALPVTDPKDQAAAWAAFQAILATAKATPACRPEPAAVLFAEFLDSRSHIICPKTRRSYESALRWLDARFPEACVADLDPVALEKHAAAEAWSDSHRANVLWTVQAFVRWAGRKDFALRRPAKESRGAEAVISDAVYAAILRETRGDFYQLMRLLWCVGSRPMESGILTAEMVDWASGTVTLRKHKTKGRTGKVRILYLPTEALTILREQVDKHKTGALFRGQRGQPLSLQSVMTRMIRLSARIGHHVTAGMFRHTFATRALEKGIPDVQVASLLGHSSTAMIHRHYSHVAANGRLLREAAEKAAG